MDTLPVKGTACTLLQRTGRRLIQGFAFHFGAIVVPIHTVIQASIEQLAYGGSVNFEVVPISQMIAKGLDLRDSSKQKISTPIRFAVDNRCAKSGVS